MFVFAWEREKHEYKFPYCEVVALHAGSAVWRYSNDNLKSRQHGVSQPKLVHGRERREENMEAVDSLSINEINGVATIMQERVF